MWKSEIQKLLKTRTKSLKEAEDKVKEITLENKMLREENRDFRYEKEELKDALKEIEKLVETQQYNNTINLQNKIKSILQTAKSI